MPHINLSELKVTIRNSLPTLKWMAANTRTSVDDALVEALERFVSSDDITKFDFSTLKVILVIAIPILKVIAALTPRDWDDKLVAFLDLIFKSENPASLFD